MAGTIYSGSYMGGIVLDDPATQLPATVTGSVSNKDGDAILGTAAARWTVANQGTIQSTGSAGYGIDLRAGGMVANGPSGASAALISGAGGVLVRGKRGAVNNFATITGTDAKRDGVELEAGGRVTNGNAAVTAASISGGRHAVTIRAAAGTVTNFGTLANFGTLGVADLFAGGAVTNGSSTSTKALISGAGRGVYLLGGIGTVTNFGTIEALRGVVLSDGGTVTNFGTIETRTGVILSDGGEVTNGSAAATGALISATVNGVVIGGVAGTVTNFGTIQAGVVLETVGIGRITNGSAAATSALIGGILIANGTQTVSNFGTISSFFGVVFEGGSRGRVANGSAASTDALISGQIRGVASV